ncbi:winged helix-turn-helix transcriptional regulator [Micromonospora chersina]|uniref:winged helix-turn-helix transcriptional regulator n=1 Tax=Micromonospora chersina TaxID=47854 RepID=UPI0033ED4074
MNENMYQCGVDAAMDVVGGKWKALILWALHSEPYRFNALRRALPGISERILIQQLRQLEADGVVRREVHPEMPPRVEYSLTEFGESLNEALLPLGEWGVRNMQRIVAARRSEEPVPARPAARS